MNTAQALEKLKAEGVASEDVRYLVEFVETTKRGIIR
jgi:UDP-N-acetylglucosamine acyltransferase